MAYYGEEILPDSTGRVYLSLSDYEGDLSVQEVINADWLIETRAKAICFDKGYDGLYSFNHTKLRAGMIGKRDVCPECPSENSASLYDILAPVNYADYFDSLGVFTRAAFRNHRYPALRIAVKQRTWVFDSIKCFLKENGIPLQTFSPKDTQSQTD
jgi:hypothetical protein